MNLQYGASYYPVHRDRSCWAGDLDLMRQAGFNALRVGDFAWKRLEPREGEYDFAWLDEFIELAASRGIGILLVSPLRCAPAWMVAKDPAIQVVNDAGVRLEFGSRYTFCINHPWLVEKGLMLAEAMARRYGAHPSVIGWHLDNEYGDEPDCHCEICRRRWQQWLGDRYGTIEALNERWGTVFWGLEFDAFEQVPTPRVTKTYHHPALLLNWRRFRSDCTVEMVKQHADVIRRHSRLPVTTNLQNLWNDRTDYLELRPALDHVGMNYYPPFGRPWHAASMGMALMRTCSRPGRGFDIHELRNGPHAVPGRADNTPQPGEIERLVLHCIGHGAQAIYFFQWSAVPFGPEQTHGVLVGYDGKPKRAWHECARIGSKLEVLDRMLAGTQVESEIAVLHDFPTRWAMQGGEEWVGPRGLALELGRSLYASVRRCGHSCDVVGAGSDWARYGLLIVPVLSCVDEALADRLAAYVEGGGTLVWHPLSGWKDADAKIYPRRLHPRLEELFGVDVREYATLGPDERCRFAWNGQSYASRLFVDLPQAHDAEAAGRFEDCWFAGSPAVLQSRRGGGRAIYVAGFAEESFYIDLIRHLRGEIGLTPILDDCPPEIELIERRDGQGKRVIFLINASPAPQQLAIGQPMEDVWNGQMLSDRVDFTPWQVRVCMLHSA